MTNRFLISVAAIALIAGAGAANAQGAATEKGGGAAIQQGNTGGATTKGTEPGIKSTQSEQKSPGAAKSQSAEDRGEKSKSQSTESQTKGGAMKAEGREGRDNMKAEGREGHDKNMKAEGREGHDKSMKTEGRERTDKNMNAQGREGADKNLNAQGREGRDNMNTQTRTDERTQTTTGQAGGGAKLSTEQRTKIVSVIRSEHVEPVTNIDFSISVGTRVPRDRVHLRALPSEVVTIYPEWRGYEFFLVRNEIVVVDPRTGEIVDVLPA
jgi:hypothetical protein